MTDLMTNLEARTDEELEKALARVLGYASGEVLNEAEVRIFYQLHEEIQRRAVGVTAAEPTEIISHFTGLSCGGPLRKYLHQNRV